MDPEIIANQQTLLQIHRRNLATYLEQRATIGSSYAPPSLINGIYEARSAIRQLKVILRDAGVPVLDEPNDAEAINNISTGPLSPGGSLGSSTFNIQGPITSATTFIGGTNSIGEIRATLGDLLSDPPTQSVPSEPKKQAYASLASLRADLQSALQMSGGENTEGAVQLLRRVDAAVQAVNPHGHDSEDATYHLQRLKKAAANIAATHPLLFIAVVKIIQHLEALLP